MGSHNAYLHTVDLGDNCLQTWFTQDNKYYGCWCLKHLYVMQHTLCLYYCRITWWRSRTDQISSNTQSLFTWIFHRLMLVRLEQGYNSNQDIISGIVMRCKAVAKQACTYTIVQLNMIQWVFMIDHWIYNCTCITVILFTSSKAPFHLWQMFWIACIKGFSSTQFLISTGLCKVV